MPEHRKTISHLLLVGQREAVATISPGVSAQVKRLDHVSRRTQQVTSRSLNARDEFILSRAFSLGHHRNFWISAVLIQSPDIAVRGYRRSTRLGTLRCCHKRGPHASNKEGSAQAGPFFIQVASIRLNV